MSHAHDIFKAMKRYPAVYTDSQGSFDFEVAIVESDKAFAVTSRVRMIGSDSVGVALEDDRLRKRGRFVAGGSEYRINKTLPSPIPGLVDLKLERLSGDAKIVRDASQDIPRNFTVYVDDTPYKVHMNRSVEVEEIQADGSSLIVARMMLGFTKADETAAGLKNGSKIKVLGKTKTISTVMDDGVGMVKVLI